MSKTRKIWMFGIAFITWFALVLQLYLMINSEAAAKAPLLFTLTNFFSYFTILSNFFVAILVTVQIISPQHGFWSSITVQSAVALYIFIVALVYNLVLRSQWKPQGWQLIADNLLHVFVPLFYFIYWILFTPRGQLQWKDILPWLLFPTLYLGYSLIRGDMTHWYPYPFINAEQLGYGQVALNAFYVVIAFLLFGLLVIAINKSKRNEVFSR